MSGLRQAGEPSEESHPPLTTRWAPAARPRADADARTSLSNLKAIASLPAPAQGPEGRERDGVLSCPRRADMTSQPSARGACGKNYPRWGGARGKGRGLGLDCRSGPPGLDYLGRERATSSTHTVQVWRRARRPTLSPVNCTEAASFEFGFSQMLELCDKSVTAPPLSGYSVVWIRSLPRSCSENLLPLCSTREL